MKSVPKKSDTKLSDFESYKVVDHFDKRKDNQNIYFDALPGSSLFPQNTSFILNTKDPHNSTKRFGDILYKARCVKRQKGRRVEGKIERVTACKAVLFLNSSLKVFFDMGNL